MFKTQEKSVSKLILIVIFAFFLLLKITAPEPFQKLISPIVSTNVLQPLTESKNSKEVFGFAPYWNIDKFDNIDFNVLTTLSYFGVEVDADGSLVKWDPGYETFTSKKATNLFKKAHKHGTRVVLTLTQMNNWAIESIMDSPEAQNRLIKESVTLVKERGIDGINVDFEYMGDPGQDYRNKFSNFVDRLTKEMHRQVPASKVTVSVYASAIKDPKIYDIQVLGNKSDGIFMMAYDFAVAGSDHAIPTAPLYGHKEGKYWYDISTAVEDFLKHMPAKKLILGVPYYGYNYPVYEPGVKVPTGWGYGVAQTYSYVKDAVNPSLSGWDNLGKVAWKAYSNGYGWRMIFVEDTQSLGIKYDFAIQKGLGGVGIWALGFDEGKKELWDLLANKFGVKIADNNVFLKTIKEII